MLKIKNDYKFYNLVIQRFKNENTNPNRTVVIEILKVETFYKTQK